MKATTELAALGRIISAVKEYRHLTHDYQSLVGNTDAGSYLKQHLSIRDWLVWQQLGGEQELVSYSVTKAFA
jgi:hypothetical protein